MTFTIEPTDHWRAGDRAYCVQGLKRQGRHLVEKGRVYLVTRAEQFDNMMSDGLRFFGVDHGSAQGFSSHRFACLRGPELPHREITRRTSTSWSTAYEACRDARNAQSDECWNG